MYARHGNLVCSCELAVCFGFFLPGDHVIEDGRSVSGSRVTSRQAETAEKKPKIYIFISFYLFSKPLK